MPGPGRRATPRLAPPRRATPRRATPRDLPALRDLERAAFQPYRQASAASLRRSVTSLRQSVWVVDGPGGRLDALLVLWHHPRRLRVYDVATHPDARGQGLGRRMLEHAEAVARREGRTAISLEADPKEPGLVGWYERQGFAPGLRLPAYYRNGNAAIRLTKPVR